MKSEVRFFYGWIVVAACLVTLIISGTTYYSFSVFFKPLQDEFGWDRALTSSALTVYLLVYAFSLYIMGWLADKYGIRLVVAGGAVLLGAGFTLCSQVHSIWHLYLFYALAALGQGTLWSPTIATAQRWFIRRRGLVLGIVTAGIGFGVLVFIPIISQLIITYGWRLTYIYIGAGSWFVLTLASIFMVASPGKKGLQPYGWQELGKSADDELPKTRQLEVQLTPQWTAGETFRTKSFIMLAALHSSIMICINMIAAHFVRFAIDVGIEPTTAAGAFGLIGGLAIAGRLITGVVAERLGWNWSLALCCFGAAATVLTFFAAKSLGMIYLCAIIYGLFYGGAIPLVLGLAGHLFGTKSLAEILGMMSGVATAMGAIGPVIGGLIFDNTGSYAISFLLATVVFSTAGVLAIVIRPPRKASSLSEVR
ncbi:MFS transporter [Chloroflexota bacterium]